MYGSQPVNTRRLRAALGDPPGPPGRDRRRPLALAVRQGVQLARHPARPADPGRLHLLRGPHRHHRAGRRRRARGRGRPRGRPRVRLQQGGDPPEPRPVHGRPERRRSGVLVRVDGAHVPGPAGGDGGGRPQADPPRVGVVHGPGDRLARSPAGSASSRCGTRSAAPIPSSSNDGRARPGTSHLPAPDGAADRRRLPLPRHRLAGGAVRPVGGGAVRRRHDRRAAVRPHRPADRRLGPRARRRRRRARRLRPLLARLDPTPARSPPPSSGSPRRR